MIYYTMKHLELRLSYLKHQMTLFPKGYYGSHHGKSILCVYPLDGPHKGLRREYLVNSRNGRRYVPLVNEYIKLEQEYSALIKLWNSRYKIPPRTIQFPLKKKTHDPIPYDSFGELIPYQNPRPYKCRYKAAGHIVRSKNEAVVVSLINEMNYRLLCEPAVNLGRYYDNYPDIVFEVPEVQKIFVIEVDGAMDDEADCQKAETRRETYVRMGFREMKDVVFIRLTNDDGGVPLDVEYIRQMILAAINMSIEDLII